VTNEHQDLVGRVDEIVQLWRMGAETSVLSERVQAFRDAVEMYRQRGIVLLSGGGGEKLSRFIAEYEDLIRKIDVVLADFSTGGGAAHWFDMVDSIKKFLRHQDDPDGREDFARSNRLLESATEPLINWTHDLSVGVDWVDQHHRALIDTINEIGMLPEHYDQAHAESLLERLRRITWYHFHEEEAYLASTDRDRAHRHLAQHRYLLAELDRLIFDVHSRKVALTEETGNYLCRWLVDHIQTIDKADFQSLQR
jgi:hemerythrin